jgi:hypothetical protein
MTTSRALGRRPHDDAKPALRLASILTGAVPAHPVAVDHLRSVPFGLYSNDRFGVCGPTSCANLVRLVSAATPDGIVEPSQDDVFTLYRASGNPNFDPQTGADDNGVVMQDMLNAWLKGPALAGVRPVAFAKVDVHNDDELAAAVSIFGGILWGVTLEDAQQAQTDAGTWDFKPSGEWGGHAVLCGAYEAGGIDDVITWAERVRTTAAFRSRQLDEAWVVILPAHLKYPAFQAGVDLQALADAYNGLTGKALPLPAAPAPTPTPGAASFLDAHPALALRVDHAAARSKVTREQWLIHTLNRHFGIKETP